MTNANPEGRVLIIDDQKPFGEFLAAILAGEWQVRLALSGEEAVRVAAEFHPDVALTDIAMPGMSGLELLEALAKDHPELPVIVITAHADRHTIMAALKRHAFDFFEKPPEPEALRVAVSRGIHVHRQRKRVAEIKATIESARHDLEARARELESIYSKETSIGSPPVLPEGFQEMITRDPAFVGKLQYAAAIAPTRFPLLISGPTGAGKDLVAKAVHLASGRAGMFVAANVGGVDDTLFSDTLFGHVSGAFSGADRKRAGLIESASGGTLFLDEIGDLSPTSQVKLLRLLESGEYYPLGSDVPRRSDARVIAATHRDIEEMAASGAFRRDLYFRLKSHHVALTPLKERKDDIPLLLEHFLQHAAQELGKTVPAIPRELIPLLCAYPFPGNVRELKGMIFDAVGRHTRGVLSTQSFREKMGHPSRTSPASAKGLFAEMTDLPTLQDATSALVAEALRRSEGNQGAAARTLGMTRQALNKRLSRQGTKDE
jgi:DNA-binding NtrC family response regulator